MKKKSVAEPIVSPEIMAMAKKSVEAERPQATSNCAVCGAVCKSNATPITAEESLCWVCKRLKISAWRDTDQHASAQE